MVSFIRSPSFISFIQTQVEEKIFRAPERKGQSVLVEADAVVVRAEEGLAFLLLCTLLHPTDASPKGCELPWGFYSCSSALAVSWWFQDPWEAHQVLFVVPEKWHQSCGAPGLLLRQM